MTVRGAVTVDRGEPLIGGGETTSMVFTDKAPDELTSGLFRKWLLWAVMSLCFFAFGTALAFGFFGDQLPIVLL